MLSLAKRSGVEIDQARRDFGAERCQQVMIPLRRHFHARGQPAQFSARLPIKEASIAWGLGIVDFLDDFFHRFVVEPSMGLRGSALASRYPTPRIQNENHCRYRHRSSLAFLCC